MYVKPYNTIYMIIFITSFFTPFLPCNLIIYLFVYICYLFCDSWTAYFHQSSLTPPSWRDGHCNAVTVWHVINMYFSGLTWINIIHTSPNCPRQYPVQVSPALHCPQYCSFIVWNGPSPSVNIKMKLVLPRRLRIERLLFVAKAILELASHGWVI